MNHICKNHAELNKNPEQLQSFKLEEIIDKWWKQIKSITL